MICRASTTAPATYYSRRESLRVWSAAASDAASTCPHGQGRECRAAGVWTGPALNTFTSGRAGGESARSGAGGRPRAAVPSMTTSSAPVSGSIMSPWTRAGARDLRGTSKRASVCAPGAHRRPQSSSSPLTRGREERVVRDHADAVAHGRLDVAKPVQPRAHVDASVSARPTALVHPLSGACPSPPHAL